MSRKVLVDVNIPKEVCKRLQDLGHDTIYLTEIFPDDEADEKIFEWMELNHTPILTKDKNFPENGGELKITIDSESSVKLTRKAHKKLIDRQIFPKPLIGSWKNGKKS